MERISETFGDVLEENICHLCSRRYQLSALITFKMDRNILDTSSIRSRFNFFKLKTVLIQIFVINYEVSMALEHGYLRCDQTVTLPKHIQEVSVVWLVNPRTLS